MSKKIAVINDISGLGRCSLTAAIPVIAAMGVQPCPVPTALLSAQTGFEDYYCETCAHIPAAFADQWEKMGARFDGIFTGFCTEPEQVDAMAAFVDRFNQDDTKVLVDPILGDDGVTYKFYSDALRERSLALVERATIITPNLTELCILTGADFAALDHSDWNKLQDQIAELCAELCAQCNADTDSGRDLTILVTGIAHAGDKDKTSPEHSAGQAAERDAATTAKSGTNSASAEQFSRISGSTGAATSVFFEEGVDTISTGIFAGGSWTVCDAPLLPGSFSGTGDLFASVIIAAAVQGMTPVDAVKLAQRFLTASIRGSIDAGIYPPEGTDFEQHLHLLMEGP